jgi:hypothetical protein
MTWKQGIQMEDFLAVFSVWRKEDATIKRIREALSLNSFYRRTEENTRLTDKPLLAMKRFFGLVNKWRFYDNNRKKDRSGCNTG